MKVIILLALAFLGTVTSAKYEGYKVYKFVTKTDLQNKYLQSLEAIPDFDFWSKINKVGSPVTAMVPPRFQTKFEDYLKINNLDFSVEVENVERYFNHN